MAADIGSAYNIPVLHKLMSELWYFDNDFNVKYPFTDLSFQKLKKALKSFKNQSFTP
jgi:hypothetical protein